MAENGLPFGFWRDFPRTIFNTFSADLYLQSVVRELELATQAGKEVDPWVGKRLSWRPDLVARLLRGGILPTKTAIEIMDSPEKRYHALIESYVDTAPFFEPKVLEDPESVEKLIRWLRANRNIRPLMPKEEDYYPFLGKDPNRELRTLPREERPDANALAPVAHKRRGESPGWAHMAFMTADTPVIDEVMFEQLGKSDEYCYQTALLAAKRSVAPSIWEGLTAKITSPRWAFHALRDDLVAHGARGIPERVRLRRIVHSCPPWAVLWWDTAGFARGTLEEMYKEAILLSGQHECIPDLVEWMEERRSLTILTIKHQMRKRRDRVGAAGG
jgi:hypothetical protein